MKTLRWGVIGFGAFADVAMGPAITGTEGHTLVSISGRNMKKLEEYAEKYGASGVYTSPEDLLDDGGIDAVYVVTPNSQHHDFTVQSAGRGCHVLCEKPMAVTVEEAEDMVKVCREHNVKLQIGNMMRFNPCHTWAKQAIREGKLGEIREARGKFGYHLTPEFSMWRVEPDLSGGGAIMDVGVHTLDLLRYILGREVTRVAGMVNTGEYPFPADVNGVMLLEFEGGVIGTVNSSFDNRYRENSMEFNGTEGSMLIEGTLWRQSIGKVTLTTEGGTEAYSPPEGYPDPYVCQIEDFKKAIHKDLAPLVNGEEGVKDLKVCLGAYESSKTGKVVEVRAFPSQTE